MSKSAPAPLTMPVIPKKGEAVPAVTSLADTPPPELPPTTDLPPPPASRLPSRVQATIAVTVRLDERRYERMKSWGTTGRRVTNQEIIVAALDRFFLLSDDEREDAITAVRR